MPALNCSAYEVKSAKGGRLQIAGSQVLVRGGEAWLVNSHIPPYQPKNMPEDYAEDRARKLLLTKGEIKSITGMLQDKSQRLVPLRAYLKNGFIKLELGLGRIRKKSDKREVHKKTCPYARNAKGMPRKVVHFSLSCRDSFCDIP